MNTVETLKRLCEADGVSGDERGVIEEIVKILDVNEYTVSKTGSLIVPYIKGDGRRIVLTAHIDEIGFTVTKIDDEGFIRVAAVGGVDTRLAASSRVTVIGKERIGGVIASIPPHLMGDDDGKKAKKADELVIDVGMERARVNELVSVGDTVVIKGNLVSLSGGNVSAKAVDNRAGCLAVIMAAKKLKEKKTDADITLMFTSQEEVGLRGSASAVNMTQPDVAIAVDVTFGDCPNTPSDKCGRLGGGVMIGVSPVLDRSLSRLLRETAEEKGIPFELEVMGETTGTDADRISCAQTGIPTALISIPERYMHSQVGTVNLGDVEHAAELIVAAVERTCR